MATYTLGSVTLESVNLSKFMELYCDETKMVESVIRQNMALKEEDIVDVDKTDEPGVYNVSINGESLKIKIKLGVNC